MLCYFRGWSLQSNSWMTNIGHFPHNSLQKQRQPPERQSDWVTLSLNSISHSKIGKRGFLRRYTCCFRILKNPWKIILHQSADLYVSILYIYFHHFDFFLFSQGDYLWIGTHNCIWYIVCTLLSQHSFPRRTPDKWHTEHMFASAQNNSFLISVWL